MLVGGLFCRTALESLEIIDLGLIEVFQFYVVLDRVGKVGCC